jgi:hypothetical protein
MASSYGTQAVGLPCLICGADNSEDSVLCRECSAPMALVHDALAQQRDPRVISVIGESNVGKTVYLGFLLDMLSQRANNFEAVPRGAYSSTSSRTSSATWPTACSRPRRPWKPTSGTGRTTRCAAARPKWYRPGHARYGGRSDRRRGRCPRPSASIACSPSRSACCCSSTPPRPPTAPSQPDFFALKILSYVDSMLGGGHNEKVSVPISVVLCKADYCPECFDDPHLFAQANLNRLWNLCESRFATVSYFACSVVGSLGYATSTDGQDYVVPIPLHAALRGVLEPFEWIIDQV